MADSPQSLCFRAYAAAPPGASRLPTWPAGRLRQRTRFACQEAPLSSWSIAPRRRRTLCYVPLVCRLGNARPRLGADSADRYAARPVLARMPSGPLDVVPLAPAHPVTTVAGRHLPRRTRTGDGRPPVDRALSAVPSFSEAWRPPHCPRRTSRARRDTLPSKDRYGDAQGIPRLGAALGGRSPLRPRGVR